MIMTVIEAKDRRRALEETVLALIQEFERSTGLSVSSVSLTSERTIGHLDITTFAVRVDVDL